MAKFTVKSQGYPGFTALAMASAVTEVTLDADHAEVDGGGYLRFWNKNPAGQSPSTQVAIFAPGAWGYFQKVSQ